MTIQTDLFLQYINELMQPEKFQDYCPNGLQVQGTNTIKKIITGVSATQELVDKAIAQNADAILVHHGYFWKGESQVITGMKYKRIKALLDANVNLIGYHLPLDCHKEFGNNVQLAKLMNWNVLGSIESGLQQGLVLKGQLNTPMNAKALANQFEQQLNFKPIMIGSDDKMIKDVVWCTGAAQSYLQHAIDVGADAFITGEISENTVHNAIENNIQYFACGHHATERYGIQALGEHLAERFNIEHEFIDCPVPV
ncbi:MAG: Nif3-like dinuclear metal center hexameric protein [Saccharospirillaceae bacterium]|nr:Nif3-like dinuclear metal center hexameric protein [Saccharospirillaceae bacterium]